ncbi:MAG TPA: hypothetical protein PLR65_02185 [Anaerolineales bacterium]|nr:hypothetical protein [Anaerolineales bacterium]
MAKEFNFIWQWDIQSSPEAIWSLAADTNRFKRESPITHGFDGEPVLFQVIREGIA